MHCPLPGSSSPLSPVTPAHVCCTCFGAGQPQRQAGTGAAAGEDHQQCETPPAGNQGAGGGSGGTTLPDELTRLLTTGAGSLPAFNGLVPVHLPQDAGELPASDWYPFPLAASRSVPLPHITHPVSSMPALKLALSPAAHTPSAYGCCSVHQRRRRRHPPHLHPRPLPGIQQHRVSGASFH